MGGWVVAVGASGVTGSPPMDSHSLAEPTADGGEWESVVCVCARVCVCVKESSVSVHVHS